MKSLSLSTYIEEQVTLVLDGPEWVDVHSSGLEGDFAGGPVAPHGAQHTTQTANPGSRRRWRLSTFLNITLTCSANVVVWLEFELEPSCSRIGEEGIKELYLAGWRGKIEGDEENRVGSKVAFREHECYRSLLNDLT